MGNKLCNQLLTEISNNQVGGRVVRWFWVPGRRTIWMIVGQGPIALAVIYTEIP